MRSVLHFVRRAALSCAAVFFTYSAATLTVTLAFLVLPVLPTAVAAQAAAHSSSEVSVLLRVLPDPAIVFVVAFVLTGRLARH